MQDTKLIYKDLLHCYTSSELAEIEIKKQSNLQLQQK